MSVYSKVFPYNMYYIKILTQRQQKFIESRILFMFPIDVHEQAVPSGRGQKRELTLMWNTRYDKPSESYKKWPP